MRFARAPLPHGGGRDFGFVAAFDPHRIHRELDSVIRGRRLLAEIPQPEPVVTIDRFDHIGAGVELHAHLAKVISEQTPDPPAQRNNVKPIYLRGKKLTALADEAVRVSVFRIEQCARQPRLRVGAVITSVGVAT